ncbi:response regulator transcription factor [Undibacterium jejuense]|uniref:Response regulator transcription factor n=1 Tax=Undibacterium jejuense TaxID=1344949 RepID=A0A923HK76_9BURK|nr:response regulator transcription factor [Undibacterium jejuense]
MSVVIADDEELARRLITEYLRHHQDIHIITECETGTEAMDAINQQCPDLIFLDIQMPELTGLEVLEMTGRRSGVIFTTAYDQFALKAFDLHAIDYLLKPYSQQRFDEALNKARKLLQQTDASPETAIQQLIAENTKKNKRLLIRDRNQVHVVPIASIDYIKAEDDYILIHAAGKSWMKTQSLSDIETQLNPVQFIRIHRSYLLQLNALKGIERQNKDSVVAVLNNGEKLPVSRSGYERLKEHLQ